MWKRKLATLAVLMAMALAALGLRAATAPQSTVAGPHVQIMPADPVVPPIGPPP